MKVLNCQVLLIFFIFCPHQISTKELNICKYITHNLIIPYITYSIFNYFQTPLIKQNNGTPFFDSS